MHDTLDYIFKEGFMTNTQRKITEVCEEIKEMLLEKNRCYGDSAINPVRIFSSVNTIEQLNIRIDDKLSRIQRGTEYEDDDTELDLIGYLILKRVKLRLLKIVKDAAAVSEASEQKDEYGLTFGNIYTGA